MGEVKSVSLTKPSCEGETWNRVWEKAAGKWCNPSLAEAPSTAFSSFPREPARVPTLLFLN